MMMMMMAEEEKEEKEEWWFNEDSYKLIYGIRRDGCGCFMGMTTRNKLGCACIHQPLRMRALLGVQFAKSTPCDSEKETPFLES